MDYKKLIKDLREKLILSQEDFAKPIGVSFSTVNRWETAKHDPTIIADEETFEMSELVDQGI